MLTAEQRLKRRLRPVYTVAFLQGFVFWYVVDKLVATTVGLNATNLSLILSMQSLMTILLETPSGILADRWSRKGVMFISALFFGISTTAGTFATQPWHYLLIALGWGAFYAMYSGTYEAIVYDMLLEEQGHADDFEKRFAVTGANEGTALIISSLIGGLIAGHYGIHAPFWATLPIVALTLIIILKIKEPKLHRAEAEPSHLLRHAKETFQAVTHSPVMIALFCLSAVLIASMRLGFEFTQIWYIHLGLPLTLFGIFNASVLAALAVRGAIVSRIKMPRFHLLITSLSLTVVATLLLKINNAYVAAIGVTLTMLGILTATLVLTGLEQSRLPSKLRAGATSLLSTSGMLTFIPFATIFGVLIDQHGITKASWFVTGLVIMACILALLAYKASIKESSQSLSV